MALRLPWRKSVVGATFERGAGIRVILHAKAAMAGDLRAAITQLRETGCDIEVRVTWEPGDAEQFAEDLYNGGFPSIATSVDIQWTTYGVLFGAGPEFKLARGLKLALVADVGLQRIENRASYGGPGADVTARITDGIAFNWDAMTWLAGGAARIECREDLAACDSLVASAGDDAHYATALDEQSLRPATQVEAHAVSHAGCVQGFHEPGRAVLGLDAARALAQEQQRGRSGRARTEHGSGQDRRDQTRAQCRVTEALV